MAGYGLSNHNPKKRRAGLKENCIERRNIALQSSQTAWPVDSIESGQITAETGMRGANSVVDEDCR